MTERTIKIKVDASDASVKVKKVNGDMVALGQAADTAVNSVNEAGKSIERFGIRLSDADVKLGRFIGSSGRVHEQTGKFVSGFLASGQAVEDFNRQMVTTTGLNTKVSATAAGVSQALGGTTRNLAGFGRGAGQASIQVSQLVGQIQGGQSAFLALSQQAADLGFVLGVPLLGAVVSIAAAIGGALVNSINSAKEAAGELPTELEKRLESIRKAFSETDEASRQAFAQVELGKLNTELNEATKRVNALKKIQQDYFDLAARGNNGARLDYIRVGEEIERIEKERIAPLAALQEKVRLETLGQAQDWKEVGSEVDKSAEKIQGIAEQIRIATDRLQNGDNSARRLALALQLGLTNAEQLPPELQKALDILERAEVAAKGTASEFERLRNVAAGIDKLFTGDVSLFGGISGDTTQSDEAASRINNRIEGLRLETQTISSELAFQQAVRRGELSAEIADLELQTQLKIQKAITERDLLLAEKNITDEQKIAAEQAFQDNVTAIEAKAADDRIDVARREREAKLALQTSLATAALDIVSVFGRKSNDAQKKIAVANAVVSGYESAVLAWEAGMSTGGPYAPVVAAAYTAASLAKTGGLIRAINTGGTGGGGGGAAGAATVSLPTQPTATASVQTLEIIGLREEIERLEAADGFVSTQFVAKVLDKIDSANRLRGEG